MKRHWRFILFFLLLVIGTSLHKIEAQEVQESEEEQFSQSSKRNGEPLWDKMYVGGNFSLQLGYYTYIDVSPLVGYKFTEKFSAGPGVAYRYLSIRGYGSSSIYGGKLFARYLIGNQFFLHTEYESLNTEFSESLYNTSQTTRGWVPGFFLGGGLIQPVGERAAVMIYGLYNLMYDNIRSPYPNPWVFTVGFTI